MNSQQPSSITPGGLGNALYDTETNTWGFQRVPARNWLLQHIGQCERLLSPASPQALPTREQGVAWRKRETRNLIDAEPQLAPTHSLLGHLAQVSEVVSSSAASFDPFTSELIAFGKAKVYGTKAYVDVVAVAAGPCGEDLKLIRLRNDRYHWAGCENGDLFIPAFDENQVGWWFGSVTSPIQQITFSESGRLLAVRNALGVSFLRPVLQKQLVPQAATPGTLNYDLKAQPPSRLDTNWRADIPNAHTGGSPHIDIDINPWNEPHVAILDSAGYWTICVFEGAQWQRYTIICTPTKSAAFEEGDVASQKKVTWGAILWTGDKNSIVICSHQAICLHDVSEGAGPFGLPDLGTSLGSNSLLDMKRNSRDPRQIFVLTSLRLYWLRVFDGRERGQLARAESAAEILISIPHYRSVADLSLRLLSDPGIKDPKSTRRISTSKDEYCIPVLICSNKSSMVTCFNLGTNHRHESGISRADPFVLPQLKMWRDSIDPLTPCQIVSMALIPTRTNAIVPTAESPPRFFRLFGVARDLGVKAHMLVYSKRIKPTILAIPPQLQPRNTSAPVGLVAEDNFVTPDGPVSFEVENVIEPEMQAALGVLEGKALIPTTANDSNQELDFGWLAKEIDEHSEVASKQHLVFRDLEERINGFEEGQIDLEAGIQILIDVFTDETPAGNIDEVSSRLQDMMNAFPIELEADYEEASHALESVFLLDAGTSRALQGTSNARESGGFPSAILDNLLRLWISSFNSAVPTITRINLRSEFRRIALELFMSSYGIQSRVSVPAESEDTTVQQEITLPLREQRRPNSRGRASLSGALPTSSQVLYSSSQAANSSSPAAPRTHSQKSGFHDRDQSSSQQPKYSPHEYLRNFTNLRDAEPLSDSLTTIINQWTLGQNPAQHNNWVTPATTTTTTTNPRSTSTAAISRATQDLNHLNLNLSSSEQRRSTVAPSTSSAPLSSQPQEQTQIQSNRPAHIAASGSAADKTSLARKGKKGKKVKKDTKGKAGKPKRLPGF